MFRKVTRLLALFEGLHITRGQERFCRPCKKIPLFCPAVDTRAASLGAIESGHIREMAMNIHINRRAALSLATGLWIGLAGFAAPGLAQEAEPVAAAEAPVGKPMALKKFTKPSVAKKKVAASPRTEKVRAAKAAAADDAPPAVVISEDTSKPAKTALSPAIANANAQWPSEPVADPFAAATPAPAAPLQADALIKSVGAETHQNATVVAEPGAQVVSPDELNEIDRAAEESRPALTLASATLDAPAAPATEATSADNSTWDKTSLIGKVFIALGGLLTMASAARMFFA